MRTAAVVVDWRRPLDTLAALQSLASMDPCPDTIVCIENGCSADEIAIVRTGANSDVALLELANNIGFAAAVNLGMEHAIRSGAEWVLLLNNDAIASPNCLGRCLDEAATNPRIAAVGPAIAFADRPDRLWYGGGEVSQWFAFTRHRGLMRPASAPPPTGETGFVTGCCMLISAAAWRTAGPFRADFFAYYEDAEWCQRVKALGWQCWYVGEVLCIHAVGASPSQRGSLGLSENAAYYLARNPIRFALESRNVGLRYARLLGLMVVWNTYNAWRLMQGKKTRVALAYLHGVIDGFRGRMGPYPRAQVRH